MPAWLRIDARFGSVYRRAATPRWYCGNRSSRERPCLHGDTPLVLYICGRSRRN
jgi:hypothetical protein